MPGKVCGDALSRAERPWWLALRRDYSRDRGEHSRRSSSSDYRMEAQDPGIGAGAGVSIFLVVFLATASCPPPPSNLSINPVGSWLDPRSPLASVEQPTVAFYRDEERAREALAAGARAWEIRFAPRRPELGFVEVAEITRSAKPQEYVIERRTVQIEAHPAPTGER